MTTEDQVRKVMKSFNRGIIDDREAVRALIGLGLSPREAERRLVADPAYTPTLSEALRNPAAFVNGFTEL